MTFIFSHTVLYLLVYKFIKMCKCGLVKIICCRNLLLNREMGRRSSNARIAFSKLESRRGENHPFQDILVSFHFIFLNNIYGRNKIKSLLL